MRHKTAPCVFCTSPIRVGRKSLLLISAVLLMLASPYPAWSQGLGYGICYQPAPTGCLVDGGNGYHHPKTGSDRLLLWDDFIIKTTGIANVQITRIEYMDSAVIIYFVHDAPSAANPIEENRAGVDIESTAAHRKGFRPRQKFEQRDLAFNRCN